MLAFRWFDLVATAACISMLFVWLTMERPTSAQDPKWALCSGTVLISPSPPMPNHENLFTTVRNMHHVPEHSAIVHSQSSRAPFCIFTLKSTCHEEDTRDMNLANILPGQNVPISKCFDLVSSKEFLRTMAMTML